MYHTDAKSFAKKLMNEIVHKTRIPSTVGIGTNLYLAKIALDITAKKSKDHMGYLNEELYRETLWDHRPMHSLIEHEQFDPNEGILHHDEGIDLMPANIALSALEVSLVNALSRETILKRYIEMVKDSYDYILIDCMPSLGMITINALAAADSVLIPVQAHYLPAKGMTQLLQTIRRV